MKPFSFYREQAQPWIPSVFLLLLRRILPVPILGVAILDFDVLDDYILDVDILNVHN